MYTKLGMRMSDIAYLYHCRRSTISSVLRSNGIRTNNMGRTVNRILNTEYFDNIDTEKKAYLLGFITADGSVTYRKDREYGKVLRLEVQERDECVIDLLISELNSESKKYYREKNNKRSVQVNINSSEIVESLSKYGVIPNKTYLMANLYRELGENFERHYLRGLFDGDGSIYFSDGIPHCSFVEGIESVVIDFRDMINKNSNLKNTVKIQENNGVYRAVWNGRKSFCMLRYLYEGSSIFLPRKKHLFENIKNIYE